MMLPDELYFCLHSGEVLGMRKDVTVVTVCPIEYWNEHLCMPDYFFADHVEMPEMFSYYAFSEEAQWYTQRPIEEARAELRNLGFRENPEMQRFLSDCWS